MVVFQKFEGTRLFELQDNSEKNWTKEKTEKGIQLNIYLSIKQGKTKLYEIGRI